MNLYEILGVEPDASPGELKRVYRKLAMKHHPDRGGDVNKFQEIQKAYDVLADPKKRKRYDATGDTETVKEQNPAEQLLISIFNTQRMHDAFASGAGFSGFSNYFES